MSRTPDEWLHDYALLALRVHRQLTGSPTGALLIYRGPLELRAQVAHEEPSSAELLVENAEELLGDLPFSPERASYLGGHARALRAAARKLAGETLPLAEDVRECLGISAGWLPEELFEQTHARLDAALPRGAGSLAQRWQTWRAAYSIPPEDLDKLPALVARAVAETRRRTSAIVPLPEGEVVLCRLASGVHFAAAGEYEGGLRSTIHINGDLPFNLADLLFVVAHEGHPGHIAESMLKERHLVEGQGRLEQQVRFLLAPSFVISEGLGLHAQDIIFAGDEAQAWLTDHVLAEYGMNLNGCDLGDLHRAQNALYGVWANAALLAAEGRPDSELEAYLSRWALMSDSEARAALGSIRAPGMALYVLAYFHGWRLVSAWLDTADREARVRRLLTEQLLPADLAESR